MIYSTWNYDTREFTYYEGPGTPPATGSFRRPGAAMVPESLLAKLPSGARRVGSGPLAKGVIATTDSGLSGEGWSLDEGRGWMPLLAVLGLGFLVGRMT